MKTEMTEMQAALLAIESDEFAKRLCEISEKQEKLNAHALTSAERARMVMHAKRLAIAQAAAGCYWTLLDFSTFERDAEHSGYCVPAAVDSELATLLAALGFTRIAFAKPGEFPARMLKKICAECAECETTYDQWWEWLMGSCCGPLSKRPKCWRTHYGYYFTHQ